MHQAEDRAFIVSIVAWRGLALLDAVFVQALGLWWVSTWRGGGIVATAFAVLLIGWAVRRALRSQCRFDTYRWMVRHVIRLAVLFVVLAVATKAWM